MYKLFKYSEMKSKYKLTMCRLCLCENECLVNIFEMNDWQGYVAAEVISDIFQFQVYETDGYPHVVCCECLIKLTDFKLFKECCQKSKVTYDKMFVSSESLEDIKTEMDFGEGGSGLELCEQDPLREAESDDKLTKSEEVSNADAIESAATPIADSTQVRPIPVEMDTHPQHLRYLKHNMLQFVSKGEADADSCSMNVITNDESISETSESISLSVDIKISSSHTTEILEGKWINPGGRMHVIPPSEGDVGIWKEGEEWGRGKWVTGEEGEDGRETAPDKIVEVEKEKLECYHCGNLLMTKLSLKRHMILHGFGHTYNCDICSKVCQSNSKLKTHVLTHTGFKPYKCTECSKCCSTSENLKSHMMTHSDYKPYKCAECGKCFRWNSHLKLHMRLHMEFKPNQCSECNKSFAQNCSLIRHMKLHFEPRPFKCAECNQSYIDKSSCIRHMRKHTGFRPFKCGTCSKGFYVSSDLKKHLLIHTKVKSLNAKSSQQDIAREETSRDTMRVTVKGNQSME